MQRKHLVIILTLVLNSCAFQNEEADLIVHNAHIHSMDEAMSTYEAMAIKDGRIVELGAERQIMNKYRSEEQLDARQQHIYPGFIDGHCHFLGYGLNKQKVDLVGTKSYEEVLQRVTLFADQHPEKEWIIGRGWDQNDWHPQQYPDNILLNSLFPDRPVLLQRVDGHAALVNDAAVARAGLNISKQVSGGQMLMSNGKFTGILVDNAVDVFQKVFDDANEADKRQALLAAQDDCLAVGLTMVCDAGLDTGSIELMERMYEEGALKIRIYAMVADEPENLAYFAKRGIIEKDRFAVRSIKVYGDGALGSRGALLKRDYTDEPDHIGLQLHTREHFTEVAKWCKENGFQMATHCIGDSANALLLAVYGEVLGGTNDLRWRIEHCQVVDPKDLTKFAAFNVIPSIQPTHATSDMYWAEARLGPERIQNAYNYSGLLKQIGMLALGTDFPVEDIDPLNTFLSAVFRTDEQGWPEGGFEMPGALSREQALHGMTIWNALAAFAEGKVGSLEVGKAADLVLLDMDLLKAPEEALRKARVSGVYIAGEKVR